MIITNKTKIPGILTLAVLSTLNTACTTLGPDYERPSIDVPATYKEAPESTTAQADETATYWPWWTIYNDQILDQLIALLESDNFTLQAAEARMQQARSVADITKAAQYPSVVAGGRNDFGILVNWEVDLWGRIEREIEASGANAEASGADFDAAKLSLQAKLAQTYFLLRVQDADIHLLQNTATSYQRSLLITRNQYKSGITDRSSVAQAQLQLSNTQVQIHDAQIIRAQYEHTIAVLIGKAPADFSLTIADINVKVPDVPTTLPSNLLKRRPDIAASERRMAAASAHIGSVIAEDYPALDLFAGVTIGKGLVGGALLAAPLYSGGAPKAMRSEAEAAYNEAVAQYRQTVLNGFLEVEDNLVALRGLNDASDIQAEAVKAAREAVSIMNNQYQAGIVNYLSIVIIQASALNNERRELSILARRLTASVTLAKALGGGWIPAEPVTLNDQPATHENTDNHK